MRGATQWKRQPRENLQTKMHTERDMQYTVSQNSKRRFKKTNSEYKQKNSNLEREHAMKWSDALRIKIELMVVELNTEITNMRNQGD